MESIKVSIDKRIATLTLSRGRVNALNGSVVADVRSALVEMGNDSDVNAVILTGEGKFFSFGFDIPEFLSYSKVDFAAFLTSFTDLYTEMFMYPKPIIAALNGHTIAGGCMLALACDRRVMVDGRGKISLNEITFGSSVFAGSVEMLRFCVGDRHASEVLYSGAMYTAKEAATIGLVDQVTQVDELMPVAGRVARDFGDKDGRAFASVKSLLRSGVADEMRRAEAASIREFVDIWYSDSTWQNLQKIEIR